MSDAPRTTSATVSSANLTRGLVIGALVFVALTVAIFGYQFARIDASTAAPSWSRLRWDYSLLIAMAWPLEPLATTARLWFVCRVLAPNISFWSCFKADAANVGFSVLTPSQSGGGPAQIYLLARAGADVGTSLTISLLSFLGTLVGLMIIGLYSLAYSDLGDRAGALFGAAVWAITLSVGLMALGAIAPNVLRAIVCCVSRIWGRLTRRRGHDIGRFASRIANLIYSYRSQVVRFLRRGKLAFAGVALTSLVFLFARALMAYLAVRFLGIDADFATVIGIQLAVLFIIYFAPTPGGAGIAEGVSLAAMAAIVSPELAPYYNLLWRFTTVYLFAIAGILFTARAIAEDTRGALSGRCSTRGTI